MSHGDRKVGLGAIGIDASRAHWNLGVAALYEEAVRRHEGAIASEGPLVCSTGQHTGRSPNDKFIVRESSSEKHVAWGKVNRPIDAAAFDALKTRMHGVPRAARSCSSRIAGPAPTRRTACRSGSSPRRAWHSLFARHMFIEEQNAAARAQHEPEFTVIDAPSFTAPAGARHDQLRGLHPAQFRAAAGAHRRDELRRGDQEVDLHGDELPAAAARRDADALLGEHRAGRRRRALLRPLGHGQDDALERSDAAADRRRRARLEQRRACSTSKAAATRR